MLMSTPTILLADNNAEFLSTCSEFLELAGYQVLKASSPADVKNILKSTHVHLCIFDLRLTDDENEKDRSGLLLAMEIARSIPKIILTRFPSHEDVRDAMKMDQKALPPAVDFVDKRNGFDSLLISVKQAFSDYVRINWNLVIDWKAREVFGLVKAIEPEIMNEMLLQRAHEFTDLVGGIFYNKDRVRFDRLLWESDGRVAIVAFAYKEGREPESALMVSGSNSILEEETRRFEDCAPKIIGGTITSLIVRSETVHFSANAYVLQGHNLENVQSLIDLYRIGPEKSFNTALVTLSDDTLKSWHQGRPIRLKNKNLGLLYKEILNIRQDLLDHKTFDKRLFAIEHQAITLGVSIERYAKKIVFRYNGKSFSYLTPSTFLESENWPAALTVNSSGMLTGNNIVVDDSGHAWLTDFAKAGQVPSLWNCVALEAAVRFDWIETSDFIRRHEMEKCLIDTEFSKPDISDLESILRKPVRAIQIIRKLAFSGVTKDIFSYNLGVFFHGLRRFLDFDFQSPLTSVETARFTHILVSLSMLSTVLVQEQKKPDELAQSGYPALRVDSGAHTAIIGNRICRLSPRLYKLLQYLYDNSDRICTTDELREKVIGDNYNPTYIHTLVGRIRSLIEDRPEHPQYLISETGIGYRLIISPE